MSSRPQKKSSPGEVVAMVGLAVAAAICCGALLLFGVAGVGTILAVVFSPWVLIPTALVLVAVVAWYGRRQLRSLPTRTTEQKKVKA
ncbi:MAG: hypothetical protein ACE5F5_09460 [Acidimicrobiia bacterium]